MTETKTSYPIKEIKMDTKEMRAYYCDALIEAAHKDPRIVAVDADVQSSMGTKPFYAAFPRRGINAGIMEAHCASFAGGLSATGLVPFFHTFGTFATRRCFDQVFIAAFQDMNVKIIGGDAGVTAQLNGGTHMPFEDMGLMREIPNMTIIEPADGTMYKTVVPAMIDTYGMFYMRSCRRTVMRIYKEEATFTIGQANILQDGKSVAIIACGIMVYEALIAAQKLNDHGVSAAVIDMHTIKPIDKDTIIKMAKQCGAIVTAENHNAMGALGSAVAEVLVEHCPIPMERIGVFESFGQVGTQDYLKQTYDLTSEAIYEKAMKAITRKRV